MLELNLKYIKKFFLWAFGLIGALLLTVIALQVYYRLTPVELSDEAKALLEETKHMAQLTENGYRFVGLRAPRSLSPIEYARCIESIETERSRALLADAMANKGDWSAEKAAELNKPFEERLASCSKGEALLRGGPTRQQDARIAIGINLAQLEPRALTEDERLIEARFAEIMNGGVRGSRADPGASIPTYSEVLTIEQERILEAAQRWSSGERVAASADAANRMAHWVEFANGTLIDSMIATAVLSRQLLVLQARLAREPTINAEVVQLARGSLTPFEKLPKHVGNAIAAEMQFGRFMVDQVASGESQVGELSWIAQTLGSLTLDRNDTLNYLSHGYVEGRARAIDPSRPKMDFEALYGCVARLNMWCMVWQRNSTGRILAVIAAPSYDDYGKRAHDVRNLAAATRLTVEARARGLQDEALAKFVASAPADMRDVVTGEAFTYDAASKKLTVKLQTKSTVLGETSYGLPL